MGSLLHLFLFALYDILQQGEADAEPAVKQAANIVDPLKGIVSSVLMIIEKEHPSTDEWIEPTIGISDISLQVLYAGLQWGYVSKIK